MKTDWDVRIDETDHFVYPNNEYRYMRDAIEVQRNQIDTSSEPGEQSLTGWWYRSQSSFHLGMGQEFFDTVRGNATDQYRFDDSYGVNPWEKGEVTLQPSPVRATHNGAELDFDFATLGKPQQYQVPAKDSDGNQIEESGIIYPYKNTIYKLKWAKPDNEYDVDAGTFPELDAQGLALHPGTGGFGVETVLDVAVMGKHVWYWALVKIPYNGNSNNYVAQIRRSDIADGKNTRIYWAVNLQSRTETIDGKSIQVGLGIDPSVDNYRTARLSFRNSVLSATFGRWWWSLPNPESLGIGDDTFEWLNTETTPNVPGSKNRLLIVHPDKNYCFLDVSRTNGPILASGTQVQSDDIIYGNRSQVWAALVKDDQTAGVDIVEMDVPFVTAETPAGEIIYRMNISMNFIFLGTDIGLRVAEVNTDGDLLIGPPHETDGPVLDICNYGQYVWFTGSGTGGVYRLDLRNAVDRVSYKFSYGRDGELAYFDTADNWERAQEAQLPVNFPASHVEMFGRSGSPIWFQAPPTGGGYYYSSMSNNPPTVANGMRAERRPNIPYGWIRTPRLRLDTWEFKLFQYLRTLWDPRQVDVAPEPDADGVEGSIRPMWVPLPGAKPVNLLTADSLTASTLWKECDITGYVDTPASHPQQGKPEPLVDSGYLFQLKDKPNSTLSKAPTFKGYQVKASPTDVADKKITLPLLCARRERMRQGRTVERSTWERISAMEKLQRSGEIVDYVDYGTGETGRVIVETSRFVTTYVPQSKQEQEDRVGILLVELRLVESDTEYGD